MVGWLASLRAGQEQRLQLRPGESEIDAAAGGREQPGAGDGV